LKHPWWLNDYAGALDNSCYWIYVLQMEMQGTAMTKTPQNDDDKAPSTTSVEPRTTETVVAELPVKDDETGEEIGGPKGPEPTRFGDWEQKGRCSDF
jgi:hypothetical protein